MANLRIDSSEFKDLLKDLKRMPEVTMRQAYPYLRNQTPIRGGNARNKTKRNRLTIKSDYGYADRLDNGWSSQAPNGFTGPTMDKIEEYVNQYIDKVD